ncbi:MAG: hypothetical protein QNL04_04050, partial [SAR324 cluster bacterium]|nr:hypothetical protein [SAR324 cluster bacterium]
LPYDSYSVLFKLVQSTTRYPVQNKPKISQDQINKLFKEFCIDAVDQFSSSYVKDVQKNEKVKGFVDQAWAKVLGSKFSPHENESHIVIQGWNDHFADIPKSEGQQQIDFIDSNIQKWSARLLQSKALVSGIERAKDMWLSDSENTLGLISNFISFLLQPASKLNQNIKPKLSKLDPGSKLTELKDVFGYKNIERFLIQDQEAFVTQQVFLFSGEQNTHLYSEEKLFRADECQRIISFLSSKEELFRERGLKSTRKIEEERVFKDVKMAAEAEAKNIAIAKEEEDRIAEEAECLKSKFSQNTNHSFQGVPRKKILYIGKKENIPLIREFLREKKWIGKQTINQNTFDKLLFTTSVQGKSRSTHRFQFLVEKNKLIWLYEKLTEHKLIQCSCEEFIAYFSILDKESDKFIPLPSSASRGEGYFSGSDKVDRELIKYLKLK